MQFSERYPEGKFDIKSSKKPFKKLVFKGFLTRQTRFSFPIESNESIKTGNVIDFLYKVGFSKNISVVKERYISSVVRDDLHKLLVFYNRNILWNNAVSW